MCYQLVYLVFDFETEASLKNSAGMAAFFERLCNEGGYTLPDAQEPAAAWEAAVKRGQRSVWIMPENASGFRLTFSIIAGNWRRMYISAERNVMNKPENARALVDAGCLLYRGLAPEYGYGLVALDIQPLPPPSEGDFLPTVIHDYNFFSPRLLSRLGADKALNAPAWKVSSFEDSGVLLEMSPNPLVDRKTYTAHYQDTAAALSISSIQQGC